MAEKGGHGKIRSPRLELQLKSHAAESPAGDQFSHDLKIKNYNDLRDSTVQVPRILVVELVPEQVGDWLNATEQQLALRRCGYWISLRGLPPTTNQNTVAIQVPRNQVFHPTTRRAIMHRLGQGALP